MVWPAVTIASTTFNTTKVAEALDKLSRPMGGSSNVTAIINISAAESIDRAVHGAVDRWAGPPSFRSWARCVVLFAFEGVYLSSDKSNGSEQRPCGKPAGLLSRGAEKRTLYLSIK